MKIVCVGKLKEEYLRRAVEELSSRIAARAKLKIVELPDEALPDRFSAAEISAVKNAEGAGILRNIAEGEYAAALALGGKPLTSKEFAGLVNAQGPQLQEFVPSRHPGLDPGSPHSGIVGQARNDVRVKPAMTVRGVLRNTTGASYYAALRGESPVFIIGGTLGLSEAVLRRADIRISFSKMTFPHQLMRVILLEQIARSCGV
jgi:23S rRNA (pseudouridine1915-N3)-methyltransferase